MTTLHVVGLPHTQTTSKFLSCAYTQKVVKFCKMMRQQGYEVVLYGSEVNEAECDEHVVLITEKERAGWFGDGFNTVLTPLSWDIEEPYWQALNLRAVGEISKRVQDKDMIMLIAGTSQQIINDAFPGHIVAEWGVGYEGICSRYRAFESYAWMHWVYGKYGIVNGAWYDAVIPNFFEVDDFPLETDKDDYLLYVGRLVSRKGIETASEIAQRAGKKLVIAGPGAKKSTKQTLVTPEFKLKNKNMEYVGEVGVEERAILMGKASALLVPTYYIEPFGGVAVEAMMCGTPVITTDWGAFTETVYEGVTGFRFRTLAEGVEAVNAVGSLDPSKIREIAQSAYSLEAVGPMFKHWLDNLNGLWSNGWYN